MSLQSSAEQEAAQAKETEDEILFDVSDLGFAVEALDEPEELHSVEEPVEFFYLWDSEILLYKLFLTLKDFLRENYSLDPALILPLCDRRKIDLEDALKALPLMLAGYLNVLMPATPKQEKPNGEYND